MSNIIKYGEKLAFHPGYYIKEIVDESGLTQEDFAKRLGTTPKNLSLLIRGEQSLSIDIAMKLSRMYGTTANYWLNLQSAYDAVVALIKSEEEVAQEKNVFKELDYKYFRDNFGLPDIPRQVDEQVRRVREYLKVSTLTVFKQRDMTVSFRSCSDELTEGNIVKANAMVQLAINEALIEKAPKFDKSRINEVADYALTLTKNHKDFYPLLRRAFYEAGVIFVILPNIPGSKINGATKKVGDNVMLMVNDRRLNSDTFWFTLFHEIGHIINGDYGISFEHEEGKSEKIADEYAANALIPEALYQDFVQQNRFDVNSITEFAKGINRDPGIVLGRLQKDGKVEYNDWRMKPLRKKYKVRIKNNEGC